MKVSKSLITAFIIILSMIASYFVIEIASSLFRLSQAPSVKSIISQPIVRDIFIASSVIFIVEAGATLFRFKRNQQFWYGLCEYVFAIFSGSFVMIAVYEGIIENNIGQSIFFQTIGSLYLVVRGLNNIDDGMKKDYYMKDKIERNMKIRDLVEKSEL